MKIFSLPTVAAVTHSMCFKFEGLLDSVVYLGLSPGVCRFPLNS